MRFNWIYLFFVILFFSCTGTQDKNLQPASQWINVERSFFSVSYPDNWRFVEDGRLGSSFIIYSEYEDPKDKFKENIILKIGEVTEPGMDLDRFVQISENPDKKVIANSHIFSSERIKDDKYDKHIMVFSGDQRGFKYKYKQYYWVINDSIYVLSFSSQPDKYDTYLPEVDSIMNSFTLNIDN